jgi:hypothetical protein
MTDLRTDEISEATTTRLLATMSLPEAVETLRDIFAPRPHVTVTEFAEGICVADTRDEGLWAEIAVKDGEWVFTEPEGMLLTDLAYIGEDED